MVLRFYNTMTWPDLMTAERMARVTVLLSNLFMQQVTDGQ